METTLALRLKVGELVEVRSKEEILPTLDANACLDGLPFMPEMFRHCGMRYRVYKRAHKTCDTVFPVRSRRMANAVHLETRCDGGAHGGCQAGCLIFWKEAWLRRVDLNSERHSFTPDSSLNANESGANSGCTEDDVSRGTRTAIKSDEEPTYVCQATRLPYATTDLQWWDLRQYLEDYRSGNAGILTILKGLVYLILFRLNGVRGVAWRMRRLHDKIQQFRGGTTWPRRTGYIEKGQPTPTDILNLQLDEVVRVKPLEEILRTVDKSGRNRGMGFDQEMVPFCGGEYHVLQRVSKIINEKTGKLQEMKTPGIILDSVVCQGRYSPCRLFCPRSIYPFWREIWLERVSESATAVVNPNGHQATSPDVRALPNGAWRSVSDAAAEQRELSHK